MISSFGLSGQNTKTLLSPDASDADLQLPDNMKGQIENWLHQTFRPLPLLHSVFCVFAASAQRALHLIIRSRIAAELTTPYL